MRGEKKNRVAVPSAVSGDDEAPCAGVSEPPDARDLGLRLVVRGGLVMSEIDGLI